MITTIEDINKIILEAEKYAEAKLQKGAEQLNQKGDAWVRINNYKGMKIPDTSTFGQMLQMAGIVHPKKSNKLNAYKLMNPATSSEDLGPRITAAAAAAEIFRKHGFAAYAESRTAA